MVNVTARRFLKYKTMSIDVRFSSFGGIRTRRCNLVRAFHFSDIRGSRYEKVMFFSLLSENVKTSGNKIKAETTYRKIQIRHGAKTTMRELVKQVMHYLRNTEEMEKNCLICVTVHCAKQQFSK